MKPGDDKYVPSATRPPNKHDLEIEAKALSAAQAVSRKQILIKLAYLETYNFFSL